MFRVLPLLLIIGCGTADTGGYAPNATYPQRQDPLVLDLKDLVPNGIHELGKLDESIAALKDRGAVLKFPNELTKDQRKAIDEVLTELFGTPANPLINHPDAEHRGFTAERLAQGSVVYSQGQRCSGCHGMGGDGRGPTSVWRYPPARDFRQGKFKFVSDPSGWPSRSDIASTIATGIDGNSMPPFALLTSEQIEAVTDYAIHLMLRGRMEFDLIRMCESDSTTADIRAEANDRWPKLFAAYMLVNSKVENSVWPTRSDDIENRVRHGHSLFISESAGCIKCHVDYGRQAPLRYDVWGIAIRPADLTLGKHNGGNSDIQLNKRIRCGIPGSNMPAIPNLGADDSDIIHFLKALPDPKHLPADVRAIIYPGVK